MNRLYEDVSVIVVMGSTGVGKSKLAVEIAKRIGRGEIVNMDSMQVYEGLDIATNKPTTEEMQGVPHHLFGCIPCTDVSFSVTKFIKMAMEVIDSIAERSNVPILVGGTNYYIYSLLWTDTLPPDRSSHSPSPTESRQETIADTSAVNDRIGYEQGQSGTSDNVTSFPRRSLMESSTNSVSDSTTSTAIDVTNNLQKAAPALQSDQRASHSQSERERLLDSIGNICGVVYDGSDIHRYRDDVLKVFKENGQSNVCESAWELLRSVDGESAIRLHHRDFRKVVNRLFYIIECGRALSVETSERESKLRYKRVCMLWLDGDIDELTERINKRVDIMIQRGLLEELVDTCRLLLKSQSHCDTGSDQVLDRLDFQSGILQSIGGKEFEEYLSIALAPVGGCSIRGYRSGDESLDSVSIGAARLKRRTRRYAVVQRKWVLNKIAQRHDVYRIPVSVRNWKDVTLHTAWRICQTFMSCEAITEPSLLVSSVSDRDSDQDSKQEWKKFHCDICSRVLNGSLEWESHLRSRRHRAAVKRKNRTEKP